MSPPSAPIRFLVAVVGCWAGIRTYQLWPEGAQGGPVVAEAAASPTPPVMTTAPPTRRDVHYVPTTAWLPQARSMGQQSPSWRAAGIFNPAARWATPGVLLAGREAIPGAQAPASDFSEPAPGVGTGNPPLNYPPLLPRAAAAAPRSVPAALSRWSGSAWLFLREAAGAPDLAPGGTLGGSQAGARLAYRINGDMRRPLAISGRIYAPLERPQGAEASLGIDWKPLAGLPLHILAERRERIGREGRSDFGLTLYGGGERRVLNDRIRLEAYAQAGVVGIGERDLFADGAVRAGVPIGPVEVGAGAWGGAQPGAARLDVGPQASFRLPIGRTGIRASAEWRFRVAGDAEPGSGPTLTIGTDF
jgi:hypothetical protein